MKCQTTRETTFEIFVLGTVIAKNAIQSAQRHGILAETGLSMLQYGVLRALHRKALTIGELSKFMMVDPSTLVSVIDALSRKGLARRKRDPNDRRRIPVHITEKGIAIVAEHPDHGPFSAEDDALIQSIDALGEDKAQLLLSLLREVVSNMPDGESILQAVAHRVELHTTGKFEMPDQAQ
jgi:DNA-binding MarR family transcriptional regulator